MLQADPSAPAFATAEAHVVAPPELVAATLTDIGSWPAWQEDVSAARAQGPLALGDTFRWTSRGMRIASTVELLELPLAVGWRGRALGTRAVHVWQLEAVDGGTRVRTEESMDGWLVRALRGTMAKVLARGLEGTLEALRLEAERRAALTATADERRVAA